MKYQNEIVINRPLDEVISKFNNEENLYKWMRGLQSIEHLEGTPGEEGSKSRMKFQNGKRKMEMTETIITSRFPDEFKASYTTQGVYNEVLNKFEAIDDQSTRYSSENLFEFSNLAMKFFGWIMPNAFRKQSQKYMEDFKRFVETGETVQG